MDGAVYYAVLGDSNFWRSLWMQPSSMTIQIKATESNFLSVGLFIMLYKVIRTFESVDEILNCDHSNESY